MTSICPVHTPETCIPLFSCMDSMARRFQSLVPPNGHLTLLDLDMLHSLIEQPDTLKYLTSLLSLAEIERFQRFGYAKRRLEWLGGRLAAKHSLHALCGKIFSEAVGYSDYSVVADVHGRPCLEHQLDLYPHATISISHSRRYAAAVVHQMDSCGIDIQEKTPKLASVREQFATNKEMHLLEPTTDTLTRLGLLWTAKEAVKKCLLPSHPSFFGTIKMAEVHFEPGEKIWTARCHLTDPIPMSASIRITAFEEYLLAFASGEVNA